MALEMALEMACSEFTGTVVSAGGAKKSNDGGSFSSVKSAGGAKKNNDGGGFFGSVKSAGGAKKSNDGGAAQGTGEPDTEIEDFFVSSTATFAPVLAPGRSFGHGTGPGAAGVARRVSAESVASRQTLRYELDVHTEGVSLCHYMNNVLPWRTMVVVTFICGAFSAGLTAVFNALTPMAKALLVGHCGEIKDWVSFQAASSLYARDMLWVQLAIELVFSISALPLAYIPVIVDLRCQDRLSTPLLLKLVLIQTITIIIWMAVRISSRLTTKPTVTIGLSAVGDAFCMFILPVCAFCVLKVHGGKTLRFTAGVFVYTTAFLAVSGTLGYAALWQYQMPLTLVTIILFIVVQWRLASRTSELRTDLGAQVLLGFLNCWLRYGVVFLFLAWRHNCHIGPLASIAFWTVLAKLCNTLTRTLSLLSLLPACHGVGVFPWLILENFIPAAVFGSSEGVDFQFSITLLISAVMDLLRDCPPLRLSLKESSGRLAQRVKGSLRALSGSGPSPEAAASPGGASGAQPLAIDSSSEPVLAVGEAGASDETDLAIDTSSGAVLAGEADASDENDLIEFDEARHNMTSELASVIAVLASALVSHATKSTSSSFRIGPVAVQLVIQSIGVLVGTRLNAVELMRRGCRLPDISASRLAWINIVLSLVAAICGCLYIVWMTSVWGLAEKERCFTDDHCKR